MDVEELIGKVIGAAINVHRELGPGFLESIHEEARVVEFEYQGIRFERQKVVPILYLGRKVVNTGWISLSRIVSSSKIKP
jgi:GxxExxY protein